MRSRRNNPYSTDLQNPTVLTMHRYSAYLLLCLVTLGSARAQQAPPQPKPAPVAQSITVTTTIEPLPLAESDRSVNVIEPRQQPLVSNSVVDYLRQDASLNLQARAPNGVQADLSLRGTTFEQSLILLNGLRINDPETGHLNLDIPIPLDAVTRIDILHGSGSTFYGSDAIGGAVNLLTQPPAPGLTIIGSAGGGSYNSIEQHLRASITQGSIAEQLTGSRDTSDGFIPDRNYSSNALASETWLTWKPSGTPNPSNYTTDILLATSDRPYGANQFYGPYPSWERTKGWFASIEQQLGQQTAASFGYRRHTDLFVLFVDQPAIYENNHITTSYEGALRRADNFGANTTLSYGVEADGDTIHSNSLGDHSRNQGAAYANLSLTRPPPFLPLPRSTRRSPHRHRRWPQQWKRQCLLPQHRRRLHPHPHHAPPSQRRPRLPSPHLRRPLLRRPHHHRQPQPQTRVLLELRSRH